ncbi:MAG: hypothetical protein IT280_13430 [Ignavibacteria bacterium]|nr:hypothetical protein [Ignavibacteria bacterium]
MKTILIFIIFSSAILLLNSCGDDSTTNNNTPNCTRSVSLASPPDSSVYYLVNHTDTTIKFTWMKATCDPDKYIFERGTNFPIISGSSIIQSDTSYYYILANDSIWYFWRVKAIYTNPVETLTTNWRFLKYY